MKLKFDGFASALLLFLITAVYLSSSVHCNYLPQLPKVNQINYSTGKNWPLLNEYSKDTITGNDWPAPVRVCRYDENCCVGESCLQLDPRQADAGFQIQPKNETKSGQENLQFKINTLFLGRKKRAVGRRGHHRRSGGSSALRGANGRFKSSGKAVSQIRRRPPQRAAAKKALSSFTRPRVSSLKKTISQKPRPRVTAQKHSLKPSTGFKSQRKASVGYQLAQNKVTGKSTSLSSPKGKENRPTTSLSESSTTPKRHHLSLSSNSPNKANVGKSSASKLKPETIQPKKDLPTVIKDGGDARFPTREVQMNPKAGGRIEFQKSEITTNHLGKGTPTNPSSRARSKSLSGLDKGHDDTGHLLGASLGGKGGVDNTWPQNKEMNRGKWKSMESIISKDVKDHGKVTLSQELVYNDKISKTRPTEMRFKVEDKGGKVIRYGSVDNPKPADGG